MDILKGKSCKELSGELISIMGIAAPVIISETCRIGMPITDTIFLGHYGEQEMASAAIAESWAWSMLYLVLGISFAMDTMVSQAFGAKNFKMIGVVYQTSVFVGLVLSLPIAVLWWFTEEFMLLFQQDPHIAELSATFIRYLLPSIFPTVVYRCTDRYLQNQKITTPGMIVNMISLLLNGILNYVLIYSFNMGFVGSPLSSTITTFVGLLLLWAIILLKGYHKGSLDKFYPEAIKPSQIWQYMKIGIPSAGMIWFEVFGFNAYTLLAGMLKQDKYTATQAVAFNCLFISFILPLGFSVGASTRVGNLVGEGDANGAKFTAIFSFFFGTLWMTLQGGAISVFGKWISMIWTNEPEILEICAKLFMVVGVVAFMDGIQVLGGSIMRAVGRPNVGAVINLAGHWVIGIPLGCLYTFVFHWGLFGLWWGLAAGLLLINVVYLFYLLRIDWENEIKRSAILTKKSDENVLLNDSNDFDLSQSLDL